MALSGRTPDHRGWMTRQFAPTPRLSRDKPNHRVWPRTHYTPPIAAGQEHTTHPSRLAVNPLHTGRDCPRTHYTPVAAHTQPSTKRENKTTNKQSQFLNLCCTRVWAHTKRPLRPLQTPQLEKVGKGLPKTIFVHLLPKKNVFPSHFRDFCFLVVYAARRRHKNVRRRARIK